MSQHRRLRIFALAVSTVVWPAATSVRAQCPTEPVVENFQGGGTVACPCFIPGEEAGAVFDVPPAHYPIEILRVGIGWGSQFGGAPATLEEAINIYEGGLSNPGVPIFSLPGPQMIDGFINEFDLEPLPGEIVVGSGPFTVTLEFLNENSGDIFAPSVVHDGNGCTPGHNAVYAIPGGWADACALGVTGDWVFQVVYRQVDCEEGGPGTVPDGLHVAGNPLRIGKFPSGQLTLEWGNSCSTSDVDYELYSGVVGAYYSHFPSTCSTGGATAALISPQPFDQYFLVVPTDGVEEGSYGLDSDGVERPQGGGACKAVQTITCP